MIRARTVQDTSVPNRRAIVVGEFVPPLRCAELSADTSALSMVWLSVGNVIRDYAV